jgi:hypothetical protein
MKPRMIRTAGLVLLVLGCTSLARTLIAGDAERVLAIAFPCGFVILGFVLLVTGSRIRNRQSSRTSSST